jgi:hypothetical protein
MQAPHTHTSIRRLCGHVHCGHIGSCLFPTGYILCVLRGVSARFLRHPTVTVTVTGHVLTCQLSIFSEVGLLTVTVYADIFVTVTVTSDYEMTVTLTVWVNKYPVTVTVTLTVGSLVLTPPSGRGTLRFAIGLLIPQENSRGLKLVVHFPLGFVAKINTNSLQQGSPRLLESRGFPASPKIEGLVSVTW